MISGQLPEFLICCTYWRYSVGYISPDKYYYDKDEKGGYGYERGVMSWVGPDQEAFTVSLITRMIEVLFPESHKNL